MLVEKRPLGEVSVAAFESAKAQCRSFCCPIHASAREGLAVSERADDFPYFEKVTVNL